MAESYVGSREDERSTDQDQQRPPGATVPAVAPRTVTPDDRTRSFYLIRQLDTYLPSRILGDRGRTNPTALKAVSMPSRGAQVL